MAALKKVKEDLGAEWHVRKKNRHKHAVRDGIAHIQLQDQCHLVTPP